MGAVSGKGSKAKAQLHRPESVATSAMVIAGAMIANHVAGRATRDALFLSSFDVTALPGMLLAAALFTLVVAFFASQAMSNSGPQNVIGWSFGISGLLLLLDWGAVLIFPKVTAVIIYLHLAVAGAFLISGFWSVVNERFDPRSAKLHISQIAAGGTLGGLAGGIVAERVASLAGITAMFPLLAALHFFCCWKLIQLGSSQRVESSKGLSNPGPLSGVKVLTRAPFMRNLAVLVLIAALGATLLDYVFKAQAAARIEGTEDLLRFFAFFYTGVGLLTFLLQTSLSGATLERLGLAKTVATLPGGLALGALGVLVVPGLASATVARGAESVLRSSLFRSGYELLYTPVSPHQKRAAKPIIDVGFDRMGDALGAGIVALLILLGPQLAHPVMLGLGLLLGAMGVWMARSLHQGYVAALERSLLDRAVELDLSELEDKTTRQTVMETLGSLDVRALRDLSGTGSGLGASASKLVSEPVKEIPDKPVDPIVSQIVELRSGDSQRILRLLTSLEGLERPLVPHAIQLLAWDDVYSQVIRSLRATGPGITGQLVDGLLDPNQDFGIRRRIPRVLAAFEQPRSIEGLWQGLKDSRFEVRFQCGRALASIRRRASQDWFPPQRVFETVLREVSVDRRVWESHRLLDQMEVEEGENVLIDDFLRERASQSLEHVFRLLSLALPQEPLRIAFRGLHTEDRALRGTALEYLDSVLPSSVRNGLWPFLEGEGDARGTKESREEVLAALMQSNLSIELRLAELRGEHD